MSFASQAAIAVENALAYRQLQEIKERLATEKLYLEDEIRREYDFGEMELNTLGYQLLQMKKVNEAIEIFKLNVEAYPQAFNTYDSLGEAYMVHGDKELSATNYKKSLELKAQTTGATKLPEPSTSERKVATSERKEVKTDSKLYDGYSGDYELAPGFIVTITNEDGKLMAQATGQSKNELFASSETEFFLKVVDAHLTFVRNEQGQVTQLILHQGGRDMPAKKIR